MSKEKANEKPVEEAGVVPTQREKDMAAEIARLNARIDAAVDAGQLLAEIPGEFRFDGYETPEGQLLTGAVKFKPGKRYVIAFGHRISTAVLLKVANGEELTAEEVRDNQALVSAGEARCRQLLQRWITGGANFFVFI
jgi:hypothetical protein